MNERAQITYMQTRISRKAAETWNLSLREVMHLFRTADVLGYIERNFGLLHIEGDDAVFDDVLSYLRHKGVDPNAGAI